MSQKDPVFLCVVCLGALGDFNRKKTSTYTVAPFFYLLEVAINL